MKNSRPASGSPNAALCYFSCCALGVLAWLAPSAAAQTEAAPLAVTGEPQVREWVPPVYPEEARRAKLEGRVLVEFVVDVDGRVTGAAVKQTTDERLNEAALASVRQWLFAPALDDGKPEPCAMLVPVTFSLKAKAGPKGLVPPTMPRVAPLAPAKEKSTPDPEYPAELLERKLPGGVMLEFQVNPVGQATDATVLGASDATFVTAALQTLERWQFEPARQGSLPVASAKQAPMEFFVVEAKPDEILAANGISGWDKSWVDRPPVIEAKPAPVYPRERLLEGTAGTAEASFTLSEKGEVGEIALLSASQPEFGEALLAAMETWHFKPALKAKAPVEVRLKVGHQFAPPSPETAEGRLVKSWKDETAGFNLRTKPDRPLKPRWRLSPVYPSALREERPPGKATVEFIIDRDGRVRLPVVKSATQPAFGWAAATALSQWVFEPPQRQGQATEVRVSIPVDFSPPAD